MSPAKKTERNTKTHLPSHPNRRLNNPPHHPPIPQTRRRHLNNLLIPPLQTTLPLPQMPDPTPPIPQNLHLHMPPPIHSRLLSKNPPARALLHSPRDQPLQLPQSPHQPNPPPATPINRFHHDRQPNSFRESPHVPHALSRLRQSRQNRNLTFLRQHPRSQLIARPPQDLSARSHELHACSGQRGGEIGALGQEAVARVHGVDVVFPRQVDEQSDVRVGGGRGQAQGVGRVVGVGEVGVGVGGEGFEVKFAGGGEDAGCYFASGLGG